MCRVVESFIVTVGVIGHEVHVNQFVIDNTQEELETPDLSGLTGDDDQL